ncbi:MAG: serine/threonine protein kinase [Nitrososphaerota archaeon]|jgi:RIO kinase 2|uniref:RIO1 family regulatory kinase/ATPase domain-containing protein n=1 Tax=Candidatus Bathycorpusculum sp. TaxID=2994959 RepID=UPI00282F70F0|nr:AarF/UbiB family protein [Candidatus Termitimicrobium sp.]MCL2431682.1 AarF/UbiB family protein [Candidatus Termitimicrobium sp.]MDR0492963.1 serine/threonine protein kinase [Nitrososphaerota archaeon]
MSSAEIAVQVFRKLEREDFRILQIIEAAMAKREFVPIEQIHKYTKVPLERVTYTLDKLDKLNLIYRTHGAYLGYTLNYAGYDCLAINALVKAEIITSFGQTVGVGKEADVYDALSPSEKRIAVKFHRLGRISFRQTRRKRSYIREHSSWLFQSHLAAEREFQTMKLVYENDVSVPQPLSQNRHVIAMGMIEGGELSRYKDIGEAPKVLQEILQNIKKAYLNAHIIHADLSEYNLILRPDGHILIIDWPQAIKTDHKNATELLERDLKNVLTFFNRKFNVELTVAETYKYVIGEAKKLPL